MIRFFLFGIAVTNYLLHTLRWVLIFILTSWHSCGQLALEVVGHLRFFRKLHGHLEHENGASIHAIRVCIDLPATVMNNFLANSETHAQSIGVLIRSALEFSEQSENLVQIILWDSFARVFDMHLQLLLLKVIGCKDRDSALACKLERILGQIDQHLLKSNLISNKLLRQYQRIIYRCLIICRNLQLALVLCAIDLEWSRFANVLLYGKRCSHDLDIQIDLLLLGLQLKYVWNES